MKKCNELQENSGKKISKLGSKISEQKVLFLRDWNYKKKKKSRSKEFIDEIDEGCNRVQVKGRPNGRKSKLIEG